MLRLRPYKLSDYEYIVKWVRNRREFCMWCADLIEYPLSREVLTKYKEKYDDDTSANIFIAVDEKGTPVGHFLLKNIDYENESGYLAFVIVDPEQRNKGYGREMIELGIKYAFDILKLSKLALCVYTNNTNAHKCYEKAGLKYCKLMKDNFKFENEYWDAYRMEIEK